MSERNNGILRAVTSMISDHVRQVNLRAGAGCGMPGCGMLTLGSHCTTCMHELCVNHAFYRIDASKPLSGPQPFCVYCIVQMNRDLFLEDDGVDDVGGGNPDRAPPRSGTRARTAPDVVDAEFTETKNRTRR